MINQQERLLFTYWQQLVHPYSPDQQLVESLFRHIEKAYQEEKRFYHNINHILQLLMLADQHTASITDITTVQFSIFYHDIKYKPGSTDNEVKSAEIAKEALLQLHVKPEIIAKVEEYILATKDHFAQKPVDADLKYFLDFDLSKLASPGEEYTTYLMQIRKEYSHLPAGEFKKGRLEFVSKALDHQYLFFTDIFRQVEYVARQNLEWELRKGLQHIE
jgi:predicted metal-dependent HD superfamily phosphohydrolase